MRMTGAPSRRAARHPNAGERRWRHPGRAASAGSFGTSPRPTPTRADLYDDFVDLYMRGVDTLDGPLISGAGHLLINASQRADLLAMVIERFCE